MSIQNIPTGPLNIAQTIGAKDIPRVFSRQRSVSDGFCLVVFRKGEYRGSIYSNEIIRENNLKERSKSLSICNDDTIWHINLSHHYLSIREKLDTSDGYTRPYTLDLEIRVNEPRSFVQCCLQRESDDPVTLARTTIEGYLRHYAIRKQHDELREDMLRDCAEEALRESSNRSFGVEVVAAHKFTLFMDPMRSKEIGSTQ